jgi:squalene-associated FAD-dependent desaturase
MTRPAGASAASDERRQLPVGNTVVVVGGGLAGLTAAIRCADAGRTVTLLEAKSRLGGLTYSFARGGLSVDNGQHVFLRCCTAYLALLDRLGVRDRVVLQPRLDIRVRDPKSGRAARLRRNGLPAPLHLAGSLARYRLLSVKQRLRFIAAALAMRRLDRAAPATDDRSFGDWLAEHHQDQTTIDAMWDLVGVATLNARPDRTSLAAAAMVFQVGLLTEASAADIGWAAVPLQELHGEAAARVLAELGVQVLTNATVTDVEPTGGRWVVRTAARDFDSDDVILAVPPVATEKLLPTTAVDHLPGWSERLPDSPIVNLHVIVDRPVLTGPFLAGAGTPIQWVFDRTGTSGGLQAHVAAPEEQAGRTGGQYLAVSVSAADDFIDEPVAALREQLLPELTALLPELADAQVLDFFVTRERHATFRPEPGTRRYRAHTTTALPGLFLAGAWTDTGWPATMEGAVRSGDAAAAAVVARPVRTGVAA